jgi:hypothetical protein
VFESGRQCLPLEIDRDELQRLWNRNGRRLQALELPGLSRGMVHFKHSQISGIRVTVSKRVEAGAENDVLRHVLLNGLGQLLFGVPAAGHHEGAKRSSKRVFAFSWTGAQFLGRLSPNNRYGQGIVEDFGLVKKLVGGASNGEFVRFG